jgi:hypothetical protein
MAGKSYEVDCSKFPSDTKCDLKITGSDKEAVIDTAYGHAIGPIHKNPPSDQLRQMIRQTVEAQG